jgi:YD repeat-containing protein
MKIKLLSIFFCILCFTLTVFSQFQTDAEARKLRGAVKKVEVFYLVPQIVGGREKIVQQIFESTVYNKEGWMIEHISYSDGKIQTKSVYLHDWKGRRIFNEYFGGSDFTDKFVYKKDSQQRLVEQQKINAVMKRPLTRVVLKYDLKGNVTEENTFYLGSSEPDETKIFEYDETDRQISQAVYDSKRVLKYKSTRKFNSEEQIIETTYESEAMFEKQTFEYDGKNRLQTILSFDLKRNEDAGKKVYKYDDEKLSEEVSDYDKNGKLMTKTVSRVDKYGNILSKVENFTEDFLKEMAKLYNARLTSEELKNLMEDSGEKSDETYRYEYDEAGNWTKRFDFGVTKSSQETQNLKPVRTEIRVISYYN